MPNRIHLRGSPASASAPRQRPAVKFRSRQRSLRARQPPAFGPDLTAGTGAYVRRPAPRHAIPDAFCLVSFKKTKNNAHLTISRLFGHQTTLASLSAGRSHGASSNGRRKTRWSQRLLFQRAFEKLAALGVAYLVIHVCGPTVSKRYLYKHYGRRFKFVVLKDVAGLPHNGCRPPVLRRK